MSEEYFSMQKDSGQMNATEENKEWVYKNAENCLNIVRNNDEIIGYAFALPCNKKLMKDFLSKKISEKELFEQIKNTKIKKPEAIYLCASVVKKEFRRRGLATSAFVKIINKIIYNIKTKPILFYWGYSKEGERLAEKVANLTGLKLRARK